MHFIKHIFIFSILFFCAHALSAQSVKPIKGRVLDQQTRQPLIGANIIVQGTSIGTITNKEGYFKIKTSRKVDTLRITYIGYNDQVVPISGDHGLLQILMKPSNVALNKLMVVGFSRGKDLQETGASIGLKTAEDLDRGDEVSLKSTLNTIPGVQMDQSRPGESRIAIRGAGISAPWGIRDIKIYLNNIPITQANGVARIEAIDVSTIGRMEVIKGPASSIYGAGVGGVIKLKPKMASYGQSSLEANGVAGSYGLTRLGATYRTGSDKFNALITYGNQTYDGYRRHSHDKRHFFTGSFLFFPSQKQTVTVLVSRSRQDTQIPGELNAQQVAKNPRQAAKSSVDKQAGRHETWTRIGISQTYDFGSRISNTTSIFDSFYKLDHPLVFAYLNNTLQRYGGRTLFTFKPYTGLAPVTFTVGGEYQSGFGDDNRFVNQNGTKGSLILNQRNTNTNYFLFAQAEVKLTHKTTLTAGVSFNNIHYKVNDLLDHSTDGKDFNGVWAPRAALVHEFNKKIALRGSISVGFSPPGTNQMKDANGNFRPEVQAEKGINYEIGARGGLLGDKLNYNIDVFSFQMKDQLVPQELGPGHRIYNNAGKTSKLGLEAALSYFWSNQASFINSIRPFISYAYSDFTFERYRILGPGSDVIANYSGNEITGISPHHLSAGLDVTAAPGFYLNATYYFRGKAPINDANSVYNKAYSLLNAKIGYKSMLGRHFKIDINAGFKNMLNTRYSSHVALNASSHGNNLPAYYNPAPERNFYSGLSIKYLF
jgi:iron complex outermembrane receptor protein